MRVGAPSLLVGTGSIALARSPSPFGSLARIAHPDSGFSESFATRLAISSKWVLHWYRPMLQVTRSGSTLVAELQCESNRMETDGLFIVVSDSLESCGQRPNKRLKLAARVD